MATNARHFGRLVREDYDRPSARLFAVSARGDRRRKLCPAHWEAAVQRRPYHRRESATFTSNQSRYQTKATL